MRRDTHARSASSPDLTGLGLSKNPFGKASGTSDAFLASLVERNVADMRRYLASGTVLGIASADDDNLRVAFVESCLESCEKPFRVFAISGSKLHQAANKDLLQSLPALADILGHDDSGSGPALILVSEAQDAGPALRTLLALADGQDQRVNTASVLLVLDETGFASADVQDAMAVTHHTQCHLELDRLRPEEAGAFVQATLFEAGCFRTDIFGEATLERVYRYSQGKLSLTELLCGKALDAIAGEGARGTVAPIDIETVVAETFASSMASRPGAELIVATTPTPRHSDPLETTGTFEETLTGIDAGGIGQSQLQPEEALEATGELPVITTVAKDIDDDEPAEDDEKLQRAMKSSREAQRSEVSAKADKGDNKAVAATHQKPPARPKPAQSKASSGKQKKKSAGQRETTNARAETRAAAQSKVAEQKASPAWIKIGIAAGVLLLVSAAAIVLWPGNRPQLPVSVSFPQSGPADTGPANIGAGAAQAVDADKLQDVGDKVDVSRATAPQGIETPPEDPLPAIQDTALDPVVTVTTGAIRQAVLVDAEPAAVPAKLTDSTGRQAVDQAIAQDDPAPAESTETAGQSAIDALLLQAEAFISQDQLTLPADSNAFKTYQQILELDENNADARQGIGRVHAIYTERGNAAMQGGRLDNAIRHYEGALRVRPTDRESQAALELAREALVSRAADLRRREQESQARAQRAMRQLETGVATGDARMIQAAIRDGAVVTGTSGNEALLVTAALNNDTAAVALLLEAGADPRVRMEAGPSALLAAAQHDNARMTEILLGSGASPNDRDEFGWSALLHAAVSGNTRLTSQLIASDANLDASDDSGRSPLMAATWNGHTAVVEQLLQAGANVNALDVNGWTALMFAAWNNHAELARTLQGAGADAGVANNDGQTAADLAIAADHPELARALSR